MRTTLILILLIMAGSICWSQHDLKVNHGKDPQPFLFYLHGAIVQEMGINAVSEEFGPYDYSGIVRAFRQKGFRVISEPRPKGTDVTAYATKLAGQIDSLILAGVPPENMVVVGASQGAYIAIEAAHQLNEPRVNYVIMALCNDYNVSFYAKYRNELCGNFLSIYEASDQKQSCDRLLDMPACKTGYREIRLNMGLGHGFIFRPYGEWIDPLTEWFTSRRVRD